jgi:hypothetical protein
MMFTERLLVYPFIAFEEISLQKLTWLILIHFEYRFD